MRKRIITLMGVTILSIGILSGCGGRDNTNNEPDTTQEVTSEQTTTDDTTTSQNSTDGDTNANDTTSGAELDNIISEEEAKNIAVKDAGVKEGDITNIRIEMDVDDGRKEYEVDFYVGNEEYDYTISAEDGTILEKDTDIDNDF